jgi:hypothetical protein
MLIVLSLCRMLRRALNVITGAQAPLVARLFACAPCGGEARLAGAWGFALSFSTRKKKAPKKNAPSSAGRLALTRRAAWLSVSGNAILLGIVAEMVLCYC